MPNKGEAPQSHRPGGVPKKNINDKKKEIVKMQSKIPRLINTKIPLQSDELSNLVSTMVAPKANKTTVPTGKNETIGSKKITTISTNFNDTQKKPDSKLHSHGESTQKPMCLHTAKGNKFAANKSSSNLSNSSRIKLDSSLIEICHVTPPRASKMQSKNTYMPKNQMHKNLTCDDNQLRVTEKNKLQAFQVVQDKLREMQSSFIKKCENLKDITTAKTKGPFKFISLVQNDFCKLILNEDDLIRLPKNLPSQSVNDFKETVKDIFSSSLDLLDNYFQELKMFEIETDWQTVFEAIRNKLEYHQERKKEELMKIIDGLCKNPCSAETELARTLEKLQEAECRFNKLKLEKQKQKSALIAQHEAELAKEIQIRKDTVAKVKRQSILSSAVQATLSQKDEKIEFKNNKINDLLTEVDELKNCIKELKTDKQKFIENKIILEEQINDLEAELRLSAIDISQLQMKLEEAEKLQIPQISFDESHEIYSLKQKLERTQRDFMSLQEQHKQSSELLQFRSEIINTLESRETELSSKVDTLQHQNLEKNSLISLITTDFHNKSDDLRAVTDTLDQKYDEVFMQNNAIKLLEENNERNQKLRVQQEEKIAELCAEIARLKKKAQENIHLNQPSQLT